MEKGRLRNTTAIRFPSRINQIVSKVHHERMLSEPIYDYIWPNTQANNVEVKITCAELETPSETMSSRITNIVSFSLPYFSTSSTQNGKIWSNDCTTKLTYSSANIRPISSTTTGYVFNSKIRSSQYGDQREETHAAKCNWFQSNTLVKHLEDKTRGLIDAPQSSGKIVSGITLPCHAEMNTLSGEHNSGKTSVHSSTLESCPAIPKENEHEQIKSTILTEMKKIKTKYSIHNFPADYIGNSVLGSRFQDWENELRFHWKDGFNEKGYVSSSDITSVSSLKVGDLDASDDFGDSLINGLGTDYPSTIWSEDVDHIRATETYSKYPREYVICDDDPRNFMEWDCDETDL